MRVVSLNIGSNLGDRRQNLLRAVAEIERLSGRKARVSRIYESEAWGYHSDNPFFNIGAEFSTDMPAGKLLELTQRVEKAAGSSRHRDAAGGYADRLLDIDIIRIGDETIDTPELKVPHPLLAERLFVLRPLAELSPRWRHPSSGKTSAQMLAELERRIAEKTE